MNLPVSLKKNVTVFFCLLLCAGAVFASSAAPEKKVPQAKEDDAFSNIQIFTRVMEIIRRHYVDKEKISYQALTYGALKGMLGALDPHSQFMEPDVFAAMKEETEGEFGGLGITISVRDGWVTIVTPMEDTPGFKAGLQSGDRILRVDRKSTERLTLGEVVKRLRGEVGTPVILTVLRPATDEIKEFNIVRANIKLDSVKEVKLLPPEIAGSEKIGYIRVTQFNEPTSKEFEAALQKLEKQSMSALVVDLRNNPGGLLDTAAGVAGKFIPAGDLIVSTEGRASLRSPDSGASVVRSVHEPKHLGYPVAVLVNTGSASGAEIVAGALKDSKKAVVIGETTFGKGSVQSVLPLPDQSAIRLTTAKYYTPSHREIHQHGVEPSVFAPMSRDMEEKLWLLKSGAPLNNEDKKFVSDACDTQLERAVFLLKGIRLYAGRLHSSNR